MEKTGNFSLDYLPKGILNLEEEGKIFYRIFNGTDSFYVGESDIHDKIPRILGCQIQFMVSTPLSSYYETSPYIGYKLEDFQTEMAA